MGVSRLLLVMCLICGLAAQASAQGRPATVGTAVVSEQEMSETVLVFGEVVSGRESAVAARVEGVALAVPPRIGDRVTAGAVLAELDTELLQIQLTQAEAQIGIAEAGLVVAQTRVARAELALKRAQTLRISANISEAQLDDRTSDFSEAIGVKGEAQARLQAAQTALAQAQYRLDNAVVRAPFDAVVLDVTTQVGQFVAAGSQVATLIDIGAMEVEANVPARYVPALGIGANVTARTDTGSALSLALRAILPTEFSATRTRPVRFEINTPEADIAVGQTVTLEVPVSAPRSVLTVPKDALVQGAGGWTVFVNADGAAQPRQVEIGAALGDAFEVVSGLASGDEVVVRGNERLRPGQAIAPNGAAPQSGG